MRDLISIILPTYNRVALLIRAVESVLFQSYDKWELIIIGDNCTDDTEIKLKKYLLDDRIEFVNLNTNVGGAEARNIGISLARGRYICFLDDDDRWLENKLSIQLNTIKSDPNIVLVYSNFTQVYSSGERRQVKLKKSVSLSELTIRNYIGSFSFVMLDAILLRDILINRDLSSCQDWDLWIKYLARNSGRAVNSKYNLIEYSVDGHEKISSDNDKVYKGYTMFVSNHAHLMSRAVLLFHEFILFDLSEGSNKKLLVKFLAGFSQIRNPKLTYYKLRYLVRSLLK